MRYIPIVLSWYPASADVVLDYPVLVTVMDVFCLVDDDVDGWKELMDDHRQMIL